MEIIDLDRLALRMLRVAAATLTLILFYLVLAGSTPSNPDASGGWRTYLANNDHTGFNPMETLITRSSASKLTLKWTAHSSNSAMIASQPVVGNGLVYWGSMDGDERATNRNGSLVWQTFLGQTTNPNCGPIPRGIVGAATVAPMTIGNSHSVLFVSGGDANFYALDALTGKIIWHTRLGLSPNAFLWSSPVVYNGSIYVGVSSFGDCPLIRGRLVKLNARDGTIQALFGLVPQGCVGASIWSSPTVDTSADMVYVSTGNGGTCNTSEPYAEAIVQLRAADLTYVGSWTVPPDQATDDGDFGATPTLFAFTSAGQTRRMVGVVNKNGLYYAFQRDALSNGPVWTARIAYGGVCPECGDGSISPSAWDGNRLYIAGGNAAINGVNCPGGLYAVNPANGSFIWQRCLKGGPVLGAVTVVPGVVEVASGNHILAISADTGRNLLNFKTADAIFGAASIWNGRLYQGDNSGNLYSLGF